MQSYNLPIEELDAPMNQVDLSCKAIAAQDSVSACGARTKSHTGGDI